MLYCVIRKITNGEVERKNLGLDGDTLVDILNVKCDPILIGSLRMQPGFHPAYHMNKDKWISVRLDGSVPAEEIKSLIAMSYEMTGPKKGRKNSYAEKRDYLKNS